MENGHLHDDKLFRAVHDRLSDYEAPSDGADWDAMSRVLDSLPKTTRYKWKISLNSILVILGLVGVSALSFALVTKTGKSPESKSNEQVTVTQPNTNREANTNPIVPVNNTQPSNGNQNSFASSNELGFTNPSNGVVTENTTNASVAKKDIPATDASMNPDDSKKRRKKNQLLFGDQIDPKKGFIYGTKESQNVVTQPVEPAPDVYYDYSDNGELKKIRINKKDSTPKGSSKKADSTAKIFVPAGAPIEGGPAGFDTE